MAVLWGQSHFDGIVAAVLLYGVALLLLRSTRLSAWNIDYNYWSFCRACRSPAWRRSGWAGGGPAWAEYQAAEVGECESGGQQHAHNPSGADGYWQILGQVVPGDIYDLMVNAENAVSKFEASGDTLAQWVCQQ